MRRVTLFFSMSLMSIAACYERTPNVTPTNEKPTPAAPPNVRSPIAASPEELPAVEVTPAPVTVGRENQLPAQTSAAPAPLPLPAQSRPLLRAGLASTGVRACDEYLARVEICTAKMLNALPDRGSAGDGLTNIIDTLDLSRRTWKRAAASAEGRENLVDACATSLKTYNRSVIDTCPLGTQ